MSDEKPIEDGGPAFPIGGCTGMSLRDYFAAKAMVARYGDAEDGEKYADIASEAYAIADAMLAARTNGV